ncbi:MAG: Dephospho-CoA kinase [Chlamydiia bacterium]|nr:Dephospho-CoA kinase [Chlamydiia bacterium]MCH9623941.1 Dephospho-CoA kinase [Chlamydiia bacterium]
MFPLEKIGANANIQVIGVTGCVSSGKSTLLCALQKMGVSTLSVDTIIHNLYKTNKELIDRIIRLLGDDVLTNHMLDRKLIADKIFDNKAMLYQMEKLTTPYVVNEIRKVANELSEPLVVEVPLLFELSLDGYFDKTILVKTDQRICEQRSSVKDIRKRNSRHLSNNEKEKRADFTITNNGTLADFNNNIHSLIEGIIT